MAYGYAVRLKYAYQTADEKTMFFSRPKVFKVNKPKRLAPFNILTLELLNMYTEKTLLTIGADDSEGIKTEAVMEDL